MGNDSMVQRICKVFQTDISLLSINRESHATNSPSNHNINFHLIYLSPTDISDDSYLTLINLYGLFHYSNNGQEA